MTVRKALICKLGVFILSPGVVKFSDVTANLSVVIHTTLQYQMLTIYLCYNNKNSLIPMQVKANASSP